MKHTVVPFFPVLLVAALSLFLGYSCTKPTPFGSGLLYDQQAEYAYTDTLTLQYTLETEDSVITSDRSSIADYMLCGQLIDPVFGKSQSDIYTLFRLSYLGPNFKNAVIDSIVMYLQYSSSGFYGDTMQAQNLRVYRLAADTVLQWDADYYSNQSLPVGDQIGEVMGFLPTPKTVGYLLGDTTSKGAYLRIPLDNAFGQELLNMDSLNLTADTTFWQKLRGLRISSEPAGAPGAMMAFALNSSAFSRIRLYYKQDTTASSYDFSFVGGNKFTNFQHDYTGTDIATKLHQPLDDQLYLQGMSGLRLKLEIPYAHLLDHVAVNKAELLLTTATLPNDNDLLTPADQLVFTESLGDTTYAFTTDVLYSLGSTGTSGFAAFGGFPETETEPAQTVKRYHLTLTQRFQDMVDNTSGDIKKQTVFINVYPQSRKAMRTVLYGPKNSTFPAKLALKYTLVK